MQRPAEPETVIRIEFQQAHGRLTGRGERHDADAVESKVNVPAVSPGMIKRNQLPRPACESSEVRALGHITAQTGEGEITCRAGTAVPAADNMIHMEREMCVLLMQQAVFAQTAGPAKNQATQGR